MKMFGYKFRPSGEDLLVHLIHHLANAPIDSGEIIKGLDLYGDASDPWTVLDESMERDGAWYVITKVNKVGSRIRRTAGCGTWKEQNSHIVPTLHYGGVDYNKGLNRYFVFQPKKGSCYSREAHGHWIMNEYSLDGQDCVICEIRNKDARGKRGRCCEYENLDDYLENKERKKKKMRIDDHDHVEDGDGFLAAEVRMMMGMMSSNNNDNDNNAGEVVEQQKDQEGIDDGVLVSEEDEEAVLAGEEEGLVMEDDEQTLVTPTTTSHHHHHLQEEQDQGDGVVSSEGMISSTCGVLDVYDDPLQIVPYEDYNNNMMDPFVNLEEEEWLKLKEAAQIFDAYYY